MKKIFFGVMLILLIHTPIRSQGISDSLNILLVKAVFRAAIVADTACLGSSYVYNENWEKIVIDSTTIMWSEDMGKVWPIGDQIGFTFIKRDGVWFLLEKKDAKFNFATLLAVLQKLKACKN